MGGKGSGNFGHSGRPGERGGSGDGGRSFSSKEEADSWGEGTQSWAENLSQEQLGAISHYTWSVGINDDLRSGKGPDRTEAYRAQVRPGDPSDDSNFRTFSRAEHLELLDSVFAKSDAVLPESVVTHRAWTGMKDQFAEMQEGDEFVDLGFTSTALSKGEIKDFSGRKSAKLEIHVPKGTKAIYLGTIGKNVTKALRGRSWMAESSELLLNRGTRFRMKGRRGKTTILEVVPNAS